MSASCCHCQTLIDSPFANSNSLRTTGCRLFVCYHCAYPNMIDLTPQFWLHSAIVAVEIDGIPNKRFRVRIESDNLQTLFAEKDEQAKAKAFKSIEAFKASEAHALTAMHGDTRFCICERCFFDLMLTCHDWISVSAPSALISQPINATCIFVPTPRPMRSEKGLCAVQPIVRAGVCMRCR